jgi:hypothetical protein
MSRGDPPGWRTADRTSGGAVEIDQRATPPRRVVEPSAAGALQLADAYWTQVAHVTRGLVRAEPQGKNVELRLLHRVPLLRFGAPQTSVTPAAVESSFPILGGALARAGGSISFAERTEPAPELRANVEGFRPRLDHPLTIGVYRQVQRRLHTAVGRRYFRDLIGGT